MIGALVSPPVAVGLLVVAALCVVGIVLVVLAAMGEDD